MESSYRRRITLRGITLSCRGITLSHFSVPFKRTSQTSRRFDFELHCSNESRGSNFSNETMEKIEYDAFRYSYTMIIVFGIFGNILVILSILRQERNVLRNNYYFLVLHLAICDLAVLIFFLFDTLELFWLGNTNSSSKIIPCPVHYIGDAFQLAGVGMMLFISLLRYRATVHPLKPATSQRKWSRLWTDVLRWLDCGRRNTFAAMLYKVNRRVRYLSEILCLVWDIVRLFHSNNIHVCGLLWISTSIDQAQQIDENSLFKCNQTTYTRFHLQYSEISPTSTSFPCLPKHCSLLRNFTYSCVSLVYMVHHW